MTLPLRIIVMVGALLTLQTVGCQTAPGSIVNAVVWTAAAGSLSAANRARGGCYAYCTPGTVCNPETGICDRLPCDGQCRSDQRCEQRFDQERCVNKKESPALRFERNSPTDTSSVAR